MEWKTATQRLYRMLDAMEVSGPAADGTNRDGAFFRWRDIANTIREQDRTIYLIGNGASASMASHFAADISKNGKIRTKVFTDLSELTALGNDIGFDHIYALPLSRYARVGDMLVAISSSGSSPNILAAVRAAKKQGVTVVTLSGFKPDNPLRSGGDINFYIPASDYGMAETCHAAILHYWMDSITPK